MDDCDEDARTLRYWKAAISCLSTPEKREVAEEFLRNKLENGRGSDTLFALILLLEANGTFLLTLPERIHDEIAQPISNRLGAFSGELLAHLERQQHMLAAIGKLQESVAASEKLFDQSRRELAFKIQTAADSVDGPGIAQRISVAVENDTLHLLKHSLRNLDQSTEAAIQATQSADRSVETWRKIQLRGIVLASVLSVVLIAGGILCWGWWRMEDCYRARLAAHVTRLSETDEAYRQFLWLGLSLRLSPWEDQSGKPVKDGYTITIDDAENAEVIATEGRNRAVVRLKAQPLVKRLELLSKEAEKLESRSQPERQKSR
jgi:hypothetical protein